MPPDLRHADAAPVAAILRLAHDLFDPRLAPGAAQAIAELLDNHPIRLIPALDHAFRDRGAHRALGLDFVRAAVDDVPPLAALGPLAPAALGVASVLRSGYVREAAIARLGDFNDPIATAFLLNRLDDYVPSVAAAAWQCIERRLAPEHADALVACLPLVRRLAARKRGGRAEAWDRVHALLISDHPACTEALRRGAAHRDSEVRRDACALLARRHAGRPEIEGILRAALDDPSPATRRWAAETARRRAITPPEALAALLPLLERDRAPSVRLVALRARARAGQVDDVVRAAFDGNASVRFFARKYLHNLGAAVDTRARALERLAHPGAPRAEIVGALAALSDVGRPEDAPAVAPFTRDPRATVAREAQRTLAMISP